LIQKDGFAMGAPSSGLIAELFLQNLEHLHLDHLSYRHKIIGYFRYVDDIVLIYDPSHTDVQNILDDFNTMHPNLEFTAETENDNKINYLDITIHKTPTSWKTSIYRKPTFTDTIIPYSSNHPAQHKYAAIRIMYNRLNTYNLHEEEYKIEEDTIHNIMFNNAFPIHLHSPPPPPSRQTTTTPDRQMTTTTQKWTTFTYVGKDTTFITNLFKKTDLKSHGEPVIPSRDY